MHTNTYDATNVLSQAADEQIWYELYIWLLPLVEKWVCYADVTSWRGQQKEVSEDIAQEAVVRTFHYNQRAGHGEVRAVESLKSLGRTIAQNYFRDRRKKDWCLLHPTQEELLLPARTLADTHADPSQIAIDHLMLITIIKTAARIVAKFPPRQRAALLTDLANLADFGEQPSLLEQALSTEGIHLHDYRGSLPSESAERNKHAVHLCIAYKRLRREVVI